MWPRVGCSPCLGCFLVCPWTRSSSRSMVAVSSGVCGDPGPALRAPRRQETSFLADGTSLPFLTWIALPLEDAGVAYTSILGSQEGIWPVTRAVAGCVSCRPVSAVRGWHVGVPVCWASGS